MSKKKAKSETPWWQVDNLDPYGDDMDFAGVSQSASDHRADQRRIELADQERAATESAMREQDWASEWMPNAPEFEQSTPVAGMPPIPQVLPPPLPLTPEQSALLTTEDAPPPIPQVWPPPLPESQTELPPLPNPIVDETAGAAATGGLDKQNALLGMIMGEGSVPGMAGGAIGGAVGGAPGAVAGNMIGRGVGAIADVAWESASTAYSTADLSSYTPGSVQPSSQGMGNGQEVVALLQSMQSSMRRVAEVGVKTTGGKPDRL